MPLANGLTSVSSTQADFSSHVLWAVDISALSPPFAGTQFVRQYPPLKAAMRARKGTFINVLCIVHVGHHSIYLPYSAYCRHPQ